MRCAQFVFTACLIIFPSIAIANNPDSEAIIGWNLISPIELTEATKALEAFEESLASLPVRMLEPNQLKSLLRKIDRRNGVLEEAGKLLQSARDAHLGLKLDQAIDLYRKTSAKLAEGFVELYDPGLLAEPSLQLGAALQQAGKNDQARNAFLQVLALVPNLKLAEGYYSPTVRKAFERVRAEHVANTPGFPLPEQLSRICSAANLDGLIVISFEQLGDRPLMSVRLFGAVKRSFTAMETMVLDEQDAAKAGRELGERLRLPVAQVAGVSLGALGPVEQPDNSVVMVAPDRAKTPPASPWYRRYWWIWPTAAVVIATAITLPLTVFRKDVVDVRIRY